MKRSVFFLLFVNCLHLPAQVMFPADANNDGKANQFDILPIGVAFAQEGFPRPGASPVWQPQFFQPWVQNLPVSNVNLGFADGNGDGLIDTLDLDVIAFNYDSAQNASQPPPHPYLLPDTCFTCPKPDLLITFDRDTGLVNDTFYAVITLRYPANVPPPAGSLGIAFDLSYDPANVKDSLTRLFPDTLPGDLMFVTATSTLAQAWRAVPPGSIGFGAAGRGMNALFSTRPLGTAQIVIEDMIIRSGEEVRFWINVSNMLIINHLEQVVCSGNVETDTILLLDPANVAEETAAWKRAVAVFPNPAGRVLHLRSPGAPLHRAEVFNPTGVLVLEEKMQPAEEALLEIGGLTPGFYFVKISAESGQAVRKFWVN